MAFVREVGKIVAPLDPALFVEAAQTVTDQEKAKGHRLASMRGHRMGQGLQRDNQKTSPSPGVQFVTPGFSALEGVSGGSVIASGRGNLAVRVG